MHIPIYMVYRPLHVYYYQTCENWMGEENEPFIKRIYVFDAMWFFWVQELLKYSLLYILYTIYNESVMTQYLYIWL